LGLLERLKEELLQLEKELEEKGCEAQEPADTDEELRAFARQILLAGGWQAELDEEVVEAIDAFLAPAPVPEELKNRVLATVRAQRKAGAGGAEVREREKVYRSGGHLRPVPLLAFRGETGGMDEMEKEKLFQAIEKFRAELSQEDQEDGSE